MTYESNRISERNAELRAMMIEAQHYRRQGRNTLATIVEEEAKNYRNQTLKLVEKLGLGNVFAWSQYPTENKPKPYTNWVHKRFPACTRFWVGLAL